MRAGSAVSEAWRNLVTGTARGALLVAVFILTVGTIAILDVRSVVGVLQEAAAYRSAGATVQVLKAEHAVDGRRCDALSGMAGVPSAGAVRQGDPVRALALPASQLSIVEATPGAIDMLATIAEPTRGDASAEGVWLSSDLADALGAELGRTIQTSAGPAKVAGIYTWPDDGRSPDLGYAMVTPVPADGTFSQCWAQTWPPDLDQSALLYVSLTGSGSQPALGQLNASLGSHFDAAAQLSDRLTASAPWAAAAVGLALGYTAVRTRRLEVASALHARVPRASLTWQHLLEAAVWGSAAAIIISAALLWTARTGNPDPSWSTWLTGLRVVMAGLGAIILGTLTAVTASREKHLFRYTKDR